MSDDLQSSDIRVIVDSGDEYSVIIQGSSTFTEMTDDNYYAVADYATSSSYAEIAGTALFVLQENFTGSFSGSFYGDGSNLIFSTLNTSQSSDSELTVGNIYNNYENKQTTIFKNGDVVVSGSTYIAEEGLLIFSPREAPDTYISGGMFYSSSGEFFIGI
jgi:hypothetical protein